MAVAVEGGGALVDADDGTDMRLQMAIVETDAVADAEIVAAWARRLVPGFVRWYRRIVGRRNLDRGVGQFPFATQFVVLDDEGGVLHRHDAPAAQIQARADRSAIGIADDLPKVQLPADFENPLGVAHQAVDDAAQVEQLQAARAAKGFDR